MAAPSGPPHIDLARIPAQPPPPGVRPNFVDAYTFAPAFIAISVVLMILTTFFLCIRFYTRIAILHVFGVTDYLLLAGYAFAMANSCLSFAQTNYGLGRHGWDIPMSFIWPYGARFTWWLIKLYVISLGFTKVAILGLYFSICPSRKFKITIWILIVSTICVAIVSFLWSVFQCWPVSNYWSFQAVAIEGKCLNKNPKYGVVGPAVTGAFNLATDLAVLILPMFMLRHMALATKRKLGAAVILATGSLASAFSAVRMVHTVVLISNSTSSAAVWASAEISLWSQGEMYAAIICACLPSTRAFCRHFYPAWKQLVSPNASKADNSSQPTHVESEKWPGTKDVEANHQEQENTGDEITPVGPGRSGVAGKGVLKEWKQPENPWYWMGLKGKTLGRLSFK